MIYMINHVQKTGVLLVIFGDVLGTVAKLFLLGPTCRNCLLRSFLGSKLVLDISFWGMCGLPTVSWILMSEKLYPMILQFLCIVQIEEDLLRFLVEAQKAYSCKPILGLCQFSRQLLHTVPQQPYVKFMPKLGKGNIYTTIKHT